MEDGVDIRGCVGEEARLGQNVWGGRLPIVWGGIFIDKKNSEMGGPLALDGRRLMGEKTTNQKSALTVEGALKGKATGEECVGGCCLFAWSGKLTKKKNDNENTSWP